MLVLFGAATVLGAACARTDLNPGDIETGESREPNSVDDAGAPEPDAQIPEPDADVEEDAEVKVIVLRGSNNHFVGGAELNEITEIHSKEEASECSSIGHHLTFSDRSLPSSRNVQSAAQ